jgi:hypothetical protein
VEVAQGGADTGESAKRAFWPKLAETPRCASLYPWQLRNAAPSGAQCSSRDNRSALLHVEVAMSKSQADRSGAAARAYLAGEDPDLDLRWVAGIDAWRQTHAYPLALVTPGVRKWVVQETAGPVIVAQ